MREKQRFGCVGQRKIGQIVWVSQLVAKFPLCHFRVIQTARSDHDPIFLELMRVEISKKEFRFRFENIWLKKPKFIDEIKSFWSSIPVVHLLPKLSEVSSYMACWGRTFFHKFKEKTKSRKTLWRDWLT